MKFPPCNRRKAFQVKLGDNVGQDAGVQRVFRDPGGNRERVGVLSATETEPDANGDVIARVVCKGGLRFTNGRGFGVDVKEAPRSKRGEEAIQPVEGIRTFREVRGEVGHNFHAMSKAALPEILARPSFHGVDAWDVVAGRAEDVVVVPNKIEVTSEGNGEVGGLSSGTFRVGVDGGSAIGTIGVEELEVVDIPPHGGLPSTPPLDAGDTTKDQGREREVVELVDQAARDQRDDAAFRCGVGFRGQHVEARCKAREGKLELRKAPVRFLEQDDVALESHLFEYSSSGEMVFTVEVEKAIRIPRREGDRGHQVGASEGSGATPKARWPRGW